MKRRNQLIVIAFIMAAVIILIIIRITSSPRPLPVTVSTETHAQDSILSVQRIDKLVAALKNDTVYEIKEVYYNPMDSSLNIAVTNKNNVIKLHAVTAQYFYKNYQIGSYNQIEGTYIFEYQNGLSFAKGNYKKPLFYDSKNLNAKVEAFKAKYYDDYLKTFRPLYKNLKENIKYPESIEIDNSGCELNENGTFHCKAIFRAKNEAGITEVQTAECDIDNEGTVTNFDLNK